MQLLFPLDREPAVSSALDTLSRSDDTRARGAVFTKPEVVRGILDLCGYTSSRNLSRERFLDPAFGHGEFLVEAVRRLIRSCERRKVPTSRWLTSLRDRVRGVELHTETFDFTRDQIVGELREHGMRRQQAVVLTDAWLHRDDFLLVDLAHSFSVIAGNPPYVRQERVPAPLLAEYKKRFSTLYDRADLYVLFYERGLDLLSAGGTLGYICANRWIKNKYGSPLREKIADGFHLKSYINLDGQNPFTEEVDAYPAITLIKRAPQAPTTIVRAPVGMPKLKVFFRAAAKPKEHRKLATSARGVTNGRDPWLVDAPQIVNVVRRLEREFPTIEADNSRITIGVASGADRIYIGNYEELPVEPDRKLPLAMSSDITGDSLAWSGRGIVNPWLESGELAKLTDFPKFAEYLRANHDQLAKRHVARKSPRAWYRTIDKIYPSLTHQPKLLIPDIKGDATVIHDDGKLYPHHNLYVVTSERWDLRALQAVLKSSVALTLVAAYSTRMAGGFLRFQAQYLRRIRIPAWESLSARQRTDLAAVGASADLTTIDGVVFDAFGLSQRARTALTRFAAQNRVSAKT